MTTLKEEEPYAAAVDKECISITCSKCFAWGVKLNRCAGCHVLYYCNAECQKEDWKDHKTECKLLRSADFVPSHDARLVMRMIEKSRKQPDFKSFNGRTYDSLDHFSAKHPENDNFKAAAKAIYDEIRRFMGTKTPDFDTALLAISKEEMNKYSIMDGSWACLNRGCGIYLGLSGMNHSCRPDAFIVNQGSKMMLRTTNKDLVYSDKLTISYFNEFPFLDTHLRRSKLQDNCSFTCKCVECMNVESDKKKTSGRPLCCPMSWFSIADRVCHNCNKEVSPGVADKARRALEAVRGAVDMFSNLQFEESAFSDVVDHWIKIFDSSKQFLSDENAYLFSIVNTINTYVPLDKANIACEYVDLSASYVRMTTLMEEEPYAAAVLTEKISTTCSKCFAWNPIGRVRVKVSRCAGCHVLSYCSSKCQKGDWKDHKPECKLLQSADFVPSEYARMVLRMIEKSRKQPDLKAFNGRTYDSLMHHSEERHRNAKSMVDAMLIYRQICRFKGTAEAPDFETVFLALSKLAINAFEILQGSWTANSSGMGLYLGLSVLDHSCRPDAYVINEGSKLVLRTTKKDLVYSDNLKISYCNGNFFLDTNRRRSKLYDNYFFVCQCEECEDIESDKKRMSGRPDCCPDSWFHIPDPICNNCKQQVSSERATKAVIAMERLDEAVTVISKRENEGSALTTLIPEWIKLFDSCKKVLSDDNTNLFAVANIIYITASHTDLELACKYADLCLPQARKSLHCLYRTMLLTRREQFYDSTHKPLQETKQALNEAIESIQVIYGPQNELTQELLQKKVLYNLMSSLNGL